MAEPLSASRRIGPADARSSTSGPVVAFRMLRERLGWYLVYFGHNAKVKGRPKLTATHNDNVTVIALGLTR